MAFQLRSPDIQPNRPIPIEHTCDGDDHSPALDWSGEPPRTRSYALIVHDPDAPRGDWVHWVLFDLPNSMHALPAGLLDTAGIEGAAQGTNDFGKVGWGGPCPPPGSPHRYVFELYALDAPLGLAPGSTRAQVDRAMRGHVLARSQLVGSYARHRRS